MRWKPNVTVAAVIERDGRFLIIEEQTEGGLMLNQPAGHLERGESLTAAVVREVREEAAHPFAPEFLVGIYHWPDAGSDITYLRFAFGGTAGIAIAGLCARLRRRLPRRAPRCARSGAPLRRSAMRGAP
jgi:8-oxo-dGTP pyrophosphatase MutT (NUDIX family)